MARRKKLNRSLYVVPNKECTNAYIHTDLKKTLEKLQTFYQKKETLKNPKKPRKVTLTWTSKKFNKIIAGMLRGEIK